MIVYKNMVVVVPRGDRTRKAPAFLSKTELVCPLCGRIDYGNTVKIKMCSRCLLDKTIAQGHIEEKMGKGLAKKPERGKIKISAKARTCRGCGNPFRGRSKSQLFCSECQRGNHHVA
jgi:hypothetical protein